MDELDAIAVPPGGCALHHVCAPGADVWRCPTHGLAEPLTTARGWHYIGCPEGDAAFDPREGERRDEAG